MTKFSVVFDASVLCSAPLRDTLMRMALADLYKANWTNKIHEEWIQTHLSEYPSAREILEKTRNLLNAHVRDSLVSGYEHIIDGINLPHHSARHVLAAAIRCNADAIITKDFQNFPKEVLEPYDIEAIHPDDFIYYQIDMAPVKCCDIFKRQRNALKQPPQSVEEFLTTLQKQELPQTTSRLKEYTNFL